MSHRRVVADDSVIWAELKGEAVLLNIDTGIYFGLNPLGTRVWQLLSEDVSEDDICSRICEDFPAEADRIAGDVAAFLDGLTSEGLLRLVEA